MGERANPGHAAGGNGSRPGPEPTPLGQMRPSARRAPGTGTRFGRGSEGQDAETQQRGERARFPAPPSLFLLFPPEAAGRAGAVPGVGGEEAGPPH